MKRCFERMLFLLVLVFFSGCASAPVIEPSPEELEAVKPFKKTVAIVDFREEGSSIRGIHAVAWAQLEHLMAGHFNLVERGKIDKVMQERDFFRSGETERFQELGKLLGADYLVFGNVVASVRGPELKHRESTSGKFYGYIWEEFCSESEVSFRMVEVSSGLVAYSDKKNAGSCGKSGEESFKDEGEFRQSLNRRSAVGQTIQIIDSFGNLKKNCSGIVSKAIESAVESFNSDLRGKFAQNGEILQILSATDVLVNLGSAYGIQPGDRLVVWEELSSIKDPKTGLVIVPKKIKANLKVIKVTSGLSAEARGSQGAISCLRIGDIVTTH